MLKTAKSGLIVWHKNDDVCENGSVAAITVKMPYIGFSNDDF